MVELQHACHHLVTWLNFVRPLQSEDEASVNHTTLLRRLRTLRPDLPYEVVAEVYVTLFAACMYDSTQESGLFQVPEAA